MYKYRSLDINTISIISSRQIFFPRYRFLNDPYDLRMTFRNNYKVFELEQLLDLIFSSGMIDETEKQELANTLKSMGSDNSDELAMFAKKIAPNRYAKLGVFCMSERWDVIPMWAHYGGNHEGVCFGFETISYPRDSSMQGLLVEGSLPEIYPRFGGFSVVPVRKVEYKTTPPAPLDPLDPLDMLDKYPAVISTKHTDWKYEKEWRAFIYPDLNQSPKISQVQRFPSTVLKEVIFGLRVSPQNQDMIQDLFVDRKEFTHVEFWKIQKSGRRLQLKRCRVTD